MSFDPETEAFVDEARRVPILDAFDRGGGSARGLRCQGREHVGPCPVHGGRRDRLNIKPSEGLFFCRGSDEGGDAIALYRHLTGADFLDACEGLLSRDRPLRDDCASAEERRARRLAAEARVADQRRSAEAEAARRDADQDAFRRREWERCLSDWRDSGPFAGSPAADYLAARHLPAPEAAYVRCHPALGYFGPAKTRLHFGPAMLVLFVMPASDGWRPIGLHRTWVAPDAPPKFRPTIVEPQTGEILASKKMRGSKAGGLLPIAGRYSRARRFVGGEGIETVLAVAGAEGFDPDTFYFAAGDLGNLAGKATKESRVRDPRRETTKASGRRMPVFVPGAEPDPDSLAVPIPNHCETLVLLGDGDSDPLFTRLAMKRAAARHARDGRAIEIRMAPAGTDFAEMAAMEAA